MNPFEHGVVAANGLNAVMARKVAARDTRTVLAHEYPFFYNPMWGHFGDAIDYDRWPPSQAEERNIYVHNDGRLSFEAPGADRDREFDSYVSDPAHPVPYRPRPIEPTYFLGGSGWYAWLVEDQRFAHASRRFELGD